MASPLDYLPEFRDGFINKRIDGEVNITCECKGMNNLCPYKDPYLISDIYDLYERYVSACYCLFRKVDSGSIIYNQLILEASRCRNSEDYSKINISMIYLLNIDIYDEYILMMTIFMLVITKGYIDINKWDTIINVLSSKTKELYNEFIEFANYTLDKLGKSGNSDKIEKIRLSVFLKRVGKSVAFPYSYPSPSSNSLELKDGDGNWETAKIVLSYLLLQKDHKAFLTINYSNLFRVMTPPSQSITLMKKILLRQEIDVYTVQTGKYESVVFTRERVNSGANFVIHAHYN